MRVIKRITLDYSDTEDRLRIAASDAEGKVFILWLTRRLADRLVPALIARLGQAAPEILDPQAHAVLQAWEQTVAKAQQKASPPVPAEDAGEILLLCAIDISGGDEQFRLVFRWDEAQPGAVLQLDATALRQWLGIVHRLYRKAEWPLYVWPAWFGEEGSISSGVPGGMLVH